MAAPAPTWWNATKTLAAVSLFSAAMLWAVPALLTQWLQNAQLAHWFVPAQPSAGAAFLVTGSALVVWSALLLAVSGGGTPLAFDAPRQLVVHGPYGWFRNPMVFGFLLQGTGVGLIDGSLAVLLQFGVMGLIWEFLLRRPDELQLERIFGREYEAYRRNVRCWLPMRRRWTPPPRSGPISLDELPPRQPGRRRRN